MSRWALVLVAVWVLWAHETTGVKHDGAWDTIDGEWTAHSEFKSLSECQAKMRAVLERQPTPGWEVTTRLSGIRGEKRNDGAMTVIETYKCLPETMDPRGPKAK